MNCKKCGYELKKEWKFCPKCSNTIESSNEIINTENIQQSETRNVEEKQEIPSSDGKDKIYLIVFLVSVACGFLIKQISGIAFVVALISIVTGYIKYPENRAIKILFWLSLIGIVVNIIFAIILVFACTESISSCGYSCS